MAIASIIEFHPKIYYVDPYGASHPLPHPFCEDRPVFRWELPDGVVQRSYIFEMRTQTPRQYASEAGVVDCAYYNSSVVTSSNPEHRVAISMRHVLDGAGQRTTIDTWLGCCEVRLRVFDASGREHTTHERTTEIYSWERGVRQNRRWGTRDDGCYFVFDDTTQTMVNTTEGYLRMPAVSDPDVPGEADLLYDVRVSRSPLFGEGLREDLPSFRFGDLRPDQGQVFARMVFQDDRGGAELSPEAAGALLPNEWYYARARAFDGADYGDWSEPQAFRAVMDDPPVCTIISAEVEKFAGEDGQMVVGDRPNGEIRVVFRVDDRDHDFVRCILAFSMKATDYDISRIMSRKSDLLNDRVKENPQGSVNYTFQEEAGGDSTHLFRARTRESLDWLPTNQDIEAHWLTDIEFDRTKTVADNIVLYLYANDGVLGGVATRRVSETIQKVSDEKAMPFSNDRNLWIAGSANWMLNYVLLPEESIRQVLPGDDTDATAKDNKGGAVGYTKDDGSAGGDGEEESGGARYPSWFDFWMAYDNGAHKWLRPSGDGWTEVSSPKSFGLSRVTQDGGFVVERYGKYPAKNSGPWDPNRPDTWPWDVKTTVIENTGYVSFCPFCDDQQVLEARYLYKGQWYKNIADAFADGETAYWDGREPWRLYYECPNCGHRFASDEFRYQPHLSANVRGLFDARRPSLWHGYSGSYAANDRLRRALQMTSRDEYDRLVSAWKKEHGDKVPCPYTYATNEAWHKSDDRETQEMLLAAADGKEWGVMPEELLAELSPRPEIEPYFDVRPPRTAGVRMLRYLDGAQLNASVEKDYMHDFEGQEATEGLDGETVEGEEGDPDMQVLARQEPWNDPRPISPEFYEGKRHVSELDESGYSTAAGGGSEDGEEGAGDGGGASSDGDGVSGEPSKTPVSQDGLPWIKSLEWVSRGGIRMRSVFQCMGVGVAMRFSMEVERGVNDRYRWRINDDGAMEGEGSILDVMDAASIRFPYSRSSAGEGRFVRDETAAMAVVKALSMALGDGGVFDIPESQVMPSSFASGSEPSGIDTVAQKISFQVYGKAARSVRSFELLPCEHSCYPLFGLVPFRQEQSRFDWPAELLSSETISTRDDVSHLVTTQSYWMASIPNARAELDLEEIPADNAIDDVGAEGGYGRFSPEASGEPIFTCDPDTVGRDGYHFRYTEEEFRSTGRIYVRTYHVETTMPFEDGGFGYRNWITVPCPGRPGRYVRRQVKSSRGRAGVLRMLDNVKRYFEDGHWEIVSEPAWYDPNDLETPLSHELEPEDDEGGSSAPTATDYDYADSSDAGGTSSGASGDAAPRCYLRKHGYAWRNALLPKTLVVFDYVPIEEAMAKNIVEMQQGIPPLNHHCPIALVGGMYIDLTKYYGRYVMGAYRLAREQRALGRPSVDDKATYEREFARSSSSRNADGEWEEFVEKTVAVLPRNWRDDAVGAEFVVEPDDASATRCLSIAKDGSHGEKTVNSYDRYRKSWLALEKRWAREAESSSSCEFAQWTVEPWNPAIGGSIAIQEKWGYQPTHTFSANWHVDPDGLINGKYIPLESRVVHGIHRDDWLEWPLLGRMLRERHLVSDKTLGSVPDDYDLAPYLDYRLLGRIAGETLRYFSGYPRSEHPAYATRPEPPYPYDRQWRVGGWNRKASVEDGTLVEPRPVVPAEVGDGAAVPLAPTRDLPGASYDDEETLVNPGFIYLQSEWNRYNRIHWMVNWSEGHRAILYAGKTAGASGGQIQWRNVRTAGAVWDDERRAWTIPYSRSASDLIDSNEALVGEDGVLEGFERGERYQFRMQIVGDNAQALPFFSTTSFAIDRYAISPATIVSTSYDPWTRTLTVVFRLDDELGRLYDIVGVGYVAQDKTLDADGHVVANDDWDEVPMSQVSGPVLDLASNRRGAATPEELLILHEIRIPLSAMPLVTGATANLRVRLISALSADRSGLTLPYFSARLWPNGLLKAVEDDIRSIEGHSNQWVYEQSADEETGEVSGSWRYVSAEEAIAVPGLLSQKLSRLDGILEAFEQSYAARASFAQDDLDAFEATLRSDAEGWQRFYYSHVTDFIAAGLAGDAEEARADYDEFMSAHTPEAADDAAAAAESLRREHVRQSGWLHARGLQAAYRAWMDENLVRFLEEARTEAATGGRTPDDRDWKALSEAFARKDLAAYRRFRGDAADPQSAQPGFVDETGADVAEEYEVEEAHAYRYALANWGRYLEFLFNTQKSSKAAVSDTRFEERAKALHDDFGAHVPGMTCPAGFGGKFARDNAVAPAMAAEFAGLSASAAALARTAEEGSPVGQLASRIAALSDAIERGVSENSSVSSEVAELREWLSSNGDALAGAAGLAADAADWLARCADELSARETAYAEFADWLSSLPDDEQSACSSDLCRKFLAEKEPDYSPSNLGKLAQRRAYMSAASPYGGTNGRVCQALNDEIAELEHRLIDDMEQKIRIETDHRASLVGQGYFCNGFEENQPYAGDKVATCFRWRVETRPYEGDRESQWRVSENGLVSYGYQRRFEMYLHFQIDFEDGFDSQDGEPLRDIWFVGDGASDADRISTGIDVGDYQATPESAPTAVKTADVPEFGGALVEDDGRTALYSARDLSDLRFNGGYGLPRTRLPGALAADAAPSYCDGAWHSDDESAAQPSEDAFRFAYLWRVAPYNILDRPVLDENAGEAADALTEEYSFSTTMRQPGAATEARPVISDGEWRPAVVHATTLRCLSAGSGVRTFFLPQDAVAETAYARRSVPVWMRDAERAAAPSGDGTAGDQPALAVSPGRSSSKWYSAERHLRGEVQFLTDRPRKLEYVDAGESPDEPPEPEPSGPTVTRDDAILVMDATIIHAVTAGQVRTSDWSSMAFALADPSAEGEDRAWTNGAWTIMHFSGTATGVTSPGWFFVLGKAIDNFSVSSGLVRITPAADSSDPYGEGVAFEQVRSGGMGPIGMGSATITCRSLLKADDPMEVLMHYDAYAAAGSRILTVQKNGQTTEVGGQEWPCYKMHDSLVVSKFADGEGVPRWKIQRYGHDGGESYPSDDPAVSDPCEGGLEDAAWPEPDEDNPEDVSYRRVFAKGYRTEDELAALLAEHSSTPDVGPVDPESRYPEDIPEDYDGEVFVVASYEGSDFFSGIVNRRFHKIGEYALTDGAGTLAPVYAVVDRNSGRRWYLSLYYDTQYNRVRLGLAVGDAPVSGEQWSPQYVSADGRPCAAISLETLNAAGAMTDTAADEGAATATAVWSSEQSREEEGEEEEDLSGKMPSVSFIEDNIGNYDIQWVPSSTVRRRPCVVLLDDGRRLLFAHKAQTRRPSGADSCVVTMSVGFSPDVFGEQQACFPRYSWQALDEALGALPDGAGTPVSFENPWVLPKAGGGYRMYFNAFFEMPDGHDECRLWRCDTRDFGEWDDFAEVPVTDGDGVALAAVQPCAVLHDGAERLYASVLRRELPGDPPLMSLAEFRPADAAGTSFVLREWLFEAAQHHVFAPSVLVLPDGTWRLFAAMRTSAPAEGVPDACVIVSRIGAADGWSDAATSETGGYPWRIEKGTPMLEGTAWEGHFVMPGEEDGLAVRFSEPCAILDRLDGAMVQRLYYTTYDAPWLWRDGELRLAEGIEEITIHTECLEEYWWRSCAISAVRDAEGAAIPVEAEDGGRHVANGASVEVSWSDPDGAPCHAVRIRAVPANALADCVSQGLWIGFGDAARHDALLSPEQPGGKSYDFGSRRALDWIAARPAILADYSAWLREPPAEEDGNPDDPAYTTDPIDLPNEHAVEEVGASAQAPGTEGQAVSFLKERGLFPEYLWWAREGEGVWRDAGRDLLSNYSWTNSDE